MGVTVGDFDGDGVLDLLLLRGSDDSPCRTAEVCWCEIRDGSVQCCEYRAIAALICACFSWPCLLQQSQQLWMTSFQLKLSQLSRCNSYRQRSEDYCISVCHDIVLMVITFLTCSL